MAEHALSKLAEGTVGFQKQCAHLIFFQITASLSRRHAGDSALYHCRTGLFNSGHVSGGKDSRDGSLPVFITNRNQAAFSRIVGCFTSCHPHKLGHRRQADCDTNRICLQMLLGPRNRLPLVIHLRYNGASHVIAALCLHNRVGKIERYSRPGQFGRMDAVSSDSFGRIYHSHYLTAGLKQLETDYQADITGSHHKNAFSRFYSMKVHHRLGRSGSDYARQRPAAKCHHILRGSRSNDNIVSLIMYELPILHDADFLFTIKADYCGI